MLPDKIGLFGNKTAVPKHGPTADGITIFSFSLCFASFTAAPKRQSRLRPSLGRSNKLSFVRKKCSSETVLRLKSRAPSLLDMRNKKTNKGKRREQWARCCSIPPHFNAQSRYDVTLRHKTKETILGTDRRNDVAMRDMARSSRSTRSQCPRDEKATNQPQIDRNPFHHTNGSEEAPTTTFENK